MFEDVNELLREIEGDLFYLDVLGDEIELLLNISSDLFYLGFFEVLFL